jgi:very-short-patch-repair endonuclease
VRALTLLDAQGLPRPIVNAKLLGEEVDFHWPERKLIVELDGPHHGRSPDRREDAARDTRLRDAGYELIRVPEPQDVVDVIRRGR